MVVRLDGRRLEDQFERGCTLQSLIDQIRRDFDDDQLVVSVALNGQVCGEQQLATCLEKPLGNGTQVDLETGDRRQIAADALRDVAQAISDAGQLQKEIAEQLNAGQAAEGVQRLGEFTQVWQNCRQTITQCCGLLACDLTTFEYDGRVLAEYLGELAEKLRELRDALEGRDTVLLADLIYYEMEPLCTTWCNLLNHVADKITADDGNL